MYAEKEIEVRYAETDQMGVVYHSNYLIWCEIGRTSFLEKLGWSYSDMEEAGTMVPVINVHLNYKRPAKYDDKVTVKTWLQSYNGLKVTYSYVISNSKGEVCLTGTSEHVCVDKETFKPFSLRKRFPALHETYLQALHKNN